MTPWFEPKSPDRLGPLETQLLRLLWERGNATVREIVDSGEIACAYTTVMTTLDRLYKKGLLTRSVEDRAFRYSPRHTPEEFRGETIRRMVGRVLGDSEQCEAISYLVDAVSEYDQELLDELQRAIERKREDLKDRRKR